MEKPRNPFETEIFKFRVPVKAGEYEISELKIRPPVVKDLLRADGHSPDDAAYVIALMSSLTGQPETVLEQMVPEDYADLRVIASQVYHRFTGYVNLLDGKGGEEAGDPKENPTPPPILPKTSEG
jgi:hypothetical protein